MNWFLKLLNRWWPLQYRQCTICFKKVNIKNGLNFISVLTWSPRHHCNAGHRQCVHIGTHFSKREVEGSNKNEMWRLGYFAPNRNWMNFNGTSIKIRLSGAVNSFWLNKVYIAYPTPVIYLDFTRLLTPGLLLWSSKQIQLFGLSVI